MKILYFEGVGMEFTEEYRKISDVGNHRIRTAFKVQNKKYYIEIGKIPIENHRKNENKMGIGIYSIIDIDNEKEIILNENTIKKLAKTNYTKNNIIKFINQYFKSNFESMEVLNQFYGYNALTSNGYNLIDNFKINHKLAKKRQEAYKKVDNEYRKYTNSKYSVISLYDMDDKSITIRSFASKEQLKDKPRILKIEIT